MKLEPSNDHNVYILGAGFSATEGLPLMGSFLNKMRDALEAFAATGRSKERTAISEVLNYRLSAASAAYWSTLDLENVEQLFSLAYAARHAVSKSLPIAMAATLDFCRDRSPARKVRVQLYDNKISCRFRPPNGASDADWAKDAPKIFRMIDAAETEGATTAHVAGLLGMVNSKSQVTGTNTFISFNYDTLVEDALTRLKVPWTYGFPAEATSGFLKAVRFEQDDEDHWGRSDAPNSIPVLKLHGSVNWTVERTKERYDQLRIYRSYDALRAELKQPRLIPPTWSKSVDDHLSLPWQSAIERLATATRIIVIGFSMPETDLHFRYLLAAGLQRNAWLRSMAFVNPDATGLEARARAVLRSSYIDQGLIRFVPALSETFAAALLGENSQLAASGPPIDIGRRAESDLRMWIGRRN